MGLGSFGIPGWRKGSDGWAGDNMILARRYYACMEEYA